MSAPNSFPNFNPSSPPVIDHRLLPSYPTSHPTPDVRMQYSPSSDHYSAPLSYPPQYEDDVGDGEDTDYDDNDAFPDSAQEHSKHILSFLWGATKGIVPPVTIIPGSDDPHVLTWSSHRHHQYILPMVSSSSDNSDSTATPPITADIVQTLAHSITSQTEVWEKIRQDK